MNDCVINITNGLKKKKSSVPRIKELFQRRTDDVNSWQGHKAGARTGPSTCGACWIQENLNTCTVQCSTPGTENWGPKDKGHRE